MKWLIASDLHGSAYWTARLLDAFHTEGAHRLLLLGDLLYHGPRNDLPRDYAPKEVIPMLNPLASQILCVRATARRKWIRWCWTFPSWPTMPSSRRGST